MSQMRYAHSLRRHWWLIAVCLLLGAVGPVVFASLVTPTYRATATLFVSIRIEEPSSAYQAGMFTQQRVRSYADIVDAPSIMSTVIDRLALSMSPDELAETVTAEAAIDTVLLRIAAEHPSATLARDIANEVATTFGSEVERLETQAGNDASPVVATLVAPATTPSSPLQPGLGITLAAGLLLGALIGIGAAVLMDALGRTVKSAEAEERLGVPVLARLPRGRGYRADEVAVLVHPQSQLAEEYRQLRALLQSASVAGTPRTLVVTSADPDDHTTDVVANLAVALAQSGDPVVAVAADPARPRLAPVLGVDGGPGLAGVAGGGTNVEEALRPSTRIREGLWVLPSGSHAASSSDVLSAEALSRVLRTLERKARYVVVEAPPLTSAAAAVLCAVASGVLLIVGHDRTRMDAAQHALERLERVGSRVEGLIVTMTPKRGPDAWPLAHPRSRVSGEQRGRAWNATDRPVVQTGSEQAPSVSTPVEGSHARR